MKKFMFTVAFLFSFSALATLPPAIGKFNSFGEGMYRGARPDEQGLSALKQMGVKTIINLQGGDLTNPDYRWVVSHMEPGEAPEAIAAEKQNSQDLGMNFINVPLDSLDPVTESEGEALGHLLHFMNDPRNQPLFIHCEHGADRTGLVVALYRVYFQNWTAQDAHAEMESMGHDTVHAIFTHGLDDFYWAATKGH